MTANKIQDVFNLINNQQFSKAEKKLKNLIKLYPENYNFINALGIVYISQKKYDHALDVFNQIIAKDPNFFDATLNVANIYKNINFFEKSEEFYKKAILLNPKNIFAIKIIRVGVNIYLISL